MTRVGDAGAVDDCGSAECMTRVGDAGSVADCGLAWSRPGQFADGGTVLAATANPLKQTEPPDTEYELALLPGNDGSTGLQFLNVPDLLGHGQRHSLNLQLR